MHIELLEELLRPGSRVFLDRAHNDLAWELATCAEPKLRDPAQAVTLARRAVELAPNAGGYWRTLGVAHYRAGSCEQAAVTLRMSMELGEGGGVDWFFLAMALWKLGDRDAARTWYGRAVAWMVEHQPTDEELLRLRAEARDLLGLEK
jgi:tetratricopeptide (TPR) repeat protein